MEKIIKNRIQTILITCIVVLGFSGCNFLFQPEEISISKIENYEQLENAVGGVYGLFKESVDNISFYYLNFTADDLFRDARYFYDLYYSYPPSKVESSFDGLDHDFVYTSLFGVITSINNILSQYNNLHSEEDQLTKEILGELFFLRAYCYFRLVRTYGNVPLVDNDDISYTMVKPTFVELYKFIESDLEIASRLLPFSKGRVAYETPTRGAAKALQAEVYLSWAGYPVKDLTKYQMAASTAEEIIDSVAYYGFDLLDDFARLWTKEGEYNKESVVAMYYNRSAVSESAFDGYCYKIFNPSTTIGNNSFSNDNEYFINGLNFSTETNFYNNYPKGYRKDITFFTLIYVPYNYTREYYGLDTGYVYIERSDEYCKPAYRKFYLDKTLINEKADYYSLFDSTNVKNYSYNLKGCSRVYLLRYAQTLLTYAEATARAGNLTYKAYECVNMIRRRAHHLDLYTPSEFDLQPGLSAEAFADSVVQERAWELAGEPEGRWFDLLRLERINETLSATEYKEYNYAYTNNKLVDYFIPIPQSDSILNPNLGEQGN